MDLTANYKLKKPAQTDTYDIQNENDNMDIVDREMAKMQGEINELETDVSNLNNKIGNIDLDASKVNFTSAFPAFTQRKVNLALDYLFQLANNGKKFWVDVVGWPLQLADTFSTLRDKTQAIKNSIAWNITNKGVPVNSTDSLQSLSDAISRISIQSLGGAIGNFASGYFDSSNTINVGFAPDMVIWIIDTKNFKLRTRDVFYPSNTNYYGMDGYDLHWYLYNPSTYANSSNLNINDNGFSVVGYHSIPPGYWMAMSYK